MGHIKMRICTPGSLAVLSRTACRKLCEEHILLSVSLWGFHSYSSNVVLALNRASEPQTDATVLLEGRCRSKRDRIVQCSVLAVITNILQCAFSDEIVLAPKLSYHSVSVLHFPLCISCVNSGVSAVCLTRRFCYKHQCDTCRTLQCGTLFVSSIFGR